MSPELALALVMCVISVTLAAALWYYRKRLHRLEKDLEAERAKSAAKEYNGAARATIKGQVAEQLAPILPGFPYHPSDFRFLGQPIDFICYVGLTEAKEGLGDISEIVLGDIKMGNARLSPHQRAIKRAVEEGRVRWETIHIDQNFSVKAKEVSR